MANLQFNTNNVKRVPISRNNLFYSESDFQYEMEIGKNYLEQDMNQTIILYEVDLLDELLNNGTVSIKKSMMEPICVGRNTNLASCLELLNSARVHMALVTDRDNNFLGIVTMEDIISELMKS